MEGFERKEKHKVVLEESNRILQWAAVTKWEFKTDPDTQRLCENKKPREKQELGKIKAILAGAVKEKKKKRFIKSLVTPLPKGITPFSYATNFIKVTSPSPPLPGLKARVCRFPRAHEPTYAEICVRGSFPPRELAAAQSNLSCR